MMVVRKGRKVYIRKPEFEELEFIAKLWADPDTMRDIGGPIPFEANRRGTWYEKMVRPGNGQNFYCLIFNNEDIPVGEVSFHRYDKQKGTAEFNIKIKHEYRGVGYAKEAIMLLLDYYFNDFGGRLMLDPLAINNKIAQDMLIGLGFENFHTDDETFVVKITKEKYNTIKQQMKLNL